MDLVTGALGKLIPKLGELLKEEYNLQKGLKKKVESLERELGSIHGFLRKVAEVPPYQLDPQVRDWAHEVREASYDMEDIIDTFLVRFQRREAAETDSLKHAMKEMASLFSLRKVKARHGIADAIEVLNNKLQEVAERRATYKLDDIVNKSAAVPDLHLQALYTDVTKVGINKAREDLIALLLSQEGDVNKLNMVSVVGIGGLGKTTLAKVVYEQLEVDFECSAFVPVRRNPDLKKVFRDILMDLDELHYTANINYFQALDERQLIHKLREFLKDKRYLIVIDDIWETQHWKDIKLALIENDRGSRIITTTRKLQVAHEVGVVYDLKPLSYENARKLFYTRVFGGDTKCANGETDKVSDKILKKCGGIPLAILAMSSLLKGKSRLEWPEIYSSISSGHIEDQEVENTMRILSLSYYDLPLHLKTCLLYLVATPEGYIISKPHLIWKWIAEGFVQEQEGIDLFEIGERYLNELIDRSMIQDVESISGVLVDSCCVHDMVFDLIRSLSHEENFVTVLANTSEAPLSRRSARRLFHRNRTIDHNPHQVNVDMAQVRSFTAAYCNIDKMAPFSRFQVLRVLAIENCKFMEGYRLEHLGKLIHLRYLGLSNSSINELPKEIGALKFLQALMLNGTGIEELPASVGLLTKLLCLSGDEKTKVPVDRIIENLSCLVDLRIFFMDSSMDNSARKFVREVGNLKELRVLVVKFAFLDESMESDLVNSLRNLHKLRHLKIDLKVPRQGRISRWEAEATFLTRHLRQLMLPDFEFSRLPTWINSSFLPSLSVLALKVKNMDAREMGILGSLPELRFLFILSSSVCLKVSGDDGYFPKLRSCWLMTGFLMFNPNECSVAPTPNLQSLHFSANVRNFKDASVYSGESQSTLFPIVYGLLNIPSLEEVMVHIHCGGASSQEVKEMEEALTQAVLAHPNHPTLQRKRYNEDWMISPSEEPNTLSLEDLDMTIDVRYYKDTDDDFNFASILWPYYHLQRVKIRINCEDAMISEVEEVETALRYAVDYHHNHPTLEIERYSEDKMKSVRAPDKHQHVDDCISTGLKHEDKDAHSISEWGIPLFLLLLVIIHFGLLAWGEVYM